MRLCTTSHLAALLLRELPPWAGVSHASMTGNGWVGLLQHAAHVCTGWQVDRCAILARHSDPQVLDDSHNLLSIG